MGKQILLRTRELHGNVSRMTPGEVLSENGDDLRVVLRGEKAVRNVKRADTMSMQSVSGQPQVNVLRNSSPVVDRQYPGRGSLYGRLAGK